MAIGKLPLYIFFSFAAVIIIGLKVVAPHEGNFFRSVVALTISRWFNLAICNGALALLLTIFWTTVKIFFDKLHPLESGHLQEKFLVFTAESVLGVAMVRGTVSVTDASMFVCTCAVTMLHNVLLKRMVMLEESALPATKRRIISISVLSALLFCFDSCIVLWLGSMVWGGLSAQTSNGRSTGIVLLLLLEWSLNAMASVTATTKLALMAVSARFPAEVTNSVRFYVEIFCELVKCVLYVAFGGALLHQSTMPLHLVREILSNVKRIATLIRDFVQHRKRMKWIEQVAIPTAEQLNEDRFCNICRDEVTDEDAVSSRILPCSHLFHVDCLAKWLERNRDCPYCQRDVEVMINDFIAAQKRNEANNNNNNSNNAAQQDAAAAAGGGDNNDVKVTQRTTNDGRTVEVTAQVISIEKNDGSGERALDEAVLKQLYEQYRTVAKAQHDQKVERRNARRQARLDSEPEFVLASSPSNATKNDSTSNTTASGPTTTPASSTHHEQQDPAAAARARFLAEKYAAASSSPPFSIGSVGGGGRGSGDAAAAASSSSPVDAALDRSFKISRSNDMNNNNKSNTVKPFVISDDSSDDDDEAFAVSQDPRSRTIAAYQRYETALERAHMQLKKDLAAVKESSSMRQD